MTQYLLKTSTVWTRRLLSKRTFSMYKLYRFSSIDCFLQQFGIPTGAKLCCFGLSARVVYRSKLKGAMPISGFPWFLAGSRQPLQDDMWGYSSQRLNESEKEGLEDEKLRFEQADLVLDGWQDQGILQFQTLWHQMRNCLSLMTKWKSMEFGSEHRNGCEKKSGEVLMVSLLRCLQVVLKLAIYSLPTIHCKQRVWRIKNQCMRSFAIWLGQRFCGMTVHGMYDTDNNYGTGLTGITDLISLQYSNFEPNLLRLVWNRTTMNAILEISSTFEWNGFCF